MNCWSWWQTGVSIYSSNHLPWPTSFTNSVLLATPSQCPCAFCSCTATNITVQITSNLTFTRACSQNPRECTSSTRGHAYTTRKWKYYTRSCVHVSCEWHAREHCEWKYYMRTYGPHMRTHAYSHLRTRTRTVLILMQSYCTRECYIDLSWALAPPSQVTCKHERALSCLWSVLYVGKGCHKMLNFVL